jgi:hypothetical protein
MARRRRRRSKAYVPFKALAQPGDIHDGSPLEIGLITLTSDKYNPKFLKITHCMELEIMDVIPGDTSFICRFCPFRYIISSRRRTQDRLHKEWIYCSWAELSVKERTDAAKGVYKQFRHMKCYTSGDNYFGEEDW